MKSFRNSGLFVCLLLISASLSAQKKALESITIPDLRNHISFLASDELEGRATGEDGLNIAARYIACQAEHTGLNPVEGENGFFQYYTLVDRSYNWDQCSIITEKPSGQVENNDHFFVFPALEESSLELSGEVVFAGYGIKDESNHYNDLEGLDLEGKIVLFMNRAPMNEDGTECLFGPTWLRMENLDLKVENLAAMKPRALFMVMDPKSGFNSLTDMVPGIERYFSKSRTLKGEARGPQVGDGGTKVVFINRSVADQILEGTGKTLAELQKEIDSSLEPHSFQLEGTRVEMNVSMNIEEKAIPNVFGYIEGSDPDLKEEMVIYMAHFDHIGTNDDGEVFNGADDNASGTVALLEIAEAYMKEKKKPERSVGFLWVSGEEIGLFGSSYFANNPMVPIESIAAVINLDMVARTINEEDMEAGRKHMTIVGEDSVKVIGGLQSKVLMDINTRTLEAMGLKGNYTYNDMNHPDRYFFRSDHINFARKDIPVLYYSTGTHSDYHKISDEVEKLDFNKFLHMTKFTFMVGFNTANYKGEITVDHPMSTW